MLRSNHFLEGVNTSQTSNTRTKGLTMTAINQGSKEHHNEL